MKYPYFEQNEFMANLAALVNIDSGSRIPGGTEKISSILENKFSGLGLHIKKHQFSPVLGPCLEIRNRPEQEHIDLLLLGHMDTVFPEGEAAKRPFSQDGNLLRGPGVADMKGGLVAAYYLIKRLVEEQADLSFCVALNSDEEISSTVSMEWIKSLARAASFAVVMEPGRKNGEFVNERKGLARYVLTVTGVSAHAGVAPQSGASAIHELARIITSLAELNHYEIGTSVNTGIISGGTAANTVCDHAQCQIDTRFNTIEEHQRIEAQIKALAVSPSDPRIHITYEIAGFRPPMRKTPQTEHIMSLMETIGKELDIDVKWTQTGGGSDGNFVAFEGCTVIDGAGPAGDRFHNQEEYLLADTAEPRIRLLHDTIIHLLKEKGK